MADGARGVLGKEGYRVFTAVDAVHGPMVAQQARPDLIVLDLMLPGGGGGVVLAAVTYWALALARAVLCA